MLDARQTVEESVKPGLPVQAPPIRRYVTLARGVYDALLIYAALVLAYWTRFGAQLGPQRQGVTSFLGYQGLALLLLGIMMFLLVIKGAYRSRLSTEVDDEFVTIVGAATMAVASVVVISFMLHQFEYSRGVIVYLWIYLIGLLAIGQAVFRGVQGALHRRGLGVRRLLIVGASDAGKMIMQSVRNRPDLGYEVAGFVDRRSPARVPDFGRFSRLGGIEDIPELIRTERIDEVVAALPGSAHEQLWEVVNLCERSGVGLKLVPDLFSLRLSHVQMDDLAGIPLLDVREGGLRWLQRFAKRALDLTVGSLVLGASLPLMTLLAILIKIDSDGPVFISQERVGRNGRQFTCWKFRTMHVGADALLTALLDRNEATGPIFKMRNDPRCTRVGRWVRRLSLDEIPQLWNVVRGEMSLVGPRPPRPEEVAKYESWQLRRLETTPGMTGLWQVSGRSNLSFDEMVMMDISYIDTWSLALDIKLLIRTFTAVVAGRGAY